MDDDEDGEDDNNVGTVFNDHALCPFRGTQAVSPTHNTQYSGERRAEVGHGQAYCEVGLMMLARRQQLGDIREDLGFQSVLRLS